MPRLLDQLWGQLRTRHYSYRTEQTYLNWIRQFILFHDKRHPSLLGIDHIGMNAVNGKQLNDDPEARRTQICHKRKCTH